MLLVLCCIMRRLHNYKQATILFHNTQGLLINSSISLRSQMFFVYLSLPSVWLKSPAWWRKRCTTSYSNNFILLSHHFLFISALTKVLQDAFWIYNHQVWLVHHQVSKLTLNTSILSAFVHCLTQFVFKFPAQTSNSSWLVFIFLLEASAYQSGQRALNIDGKSGASLTLFAVTVKSRKWWGKIAQHSQRMVEG